MGKNLFSGDVGVTIQGLRVLSLLDDKKNNLTFQVIGFEDQIRIVDYRRESLETIQKVLRGENPAMFTSVFNQPAYSDIRVNGKQNYEVSLYDTQNVNIEHMLWIAVGLEDYLPIYDYLFYEINPYLNDTFAVFACYHRAPYGRELIYLDGQLTGYEEDGVSVDEFGLTSRSFQSY